MKILCTLLLLGLLALATTDAKKKKKVEGDFEFADEDEDRILSDKAREKKRWIYDPDNELCRPLACKKKELCLLEDAFTALCANKKDIHRNGDVIVPAGAGGGRSAGAGGGAPLDDADGDDDVFYDSDDDSKPDVYQCEACPVTRPVFLCGSDNRTYSSLCRLDYHNCIHQTSVRLGCKGFCPCKGGSRGGGGRKRQGGNRLGEGGAGVRRGGGGGGGGGAAERRRAQYRFTPEDFKYDNKHYKYIKYTKYNDALNQKKHIDNSYNDALDSEPEIHNSIDDDTWSAPAAGAAAAGAAQAADETDARDCSMDKMADRLLDWFSVLMVDNAAAGHSTAAAAHHTKGFPADCKSEVRWMFAHLDSENDGVLSAKNLYSLRHDEQERCLRPFVSGCDGDSDGDVTRGEWCRCLQRAARPCLALARAATPHLYPGAYVPACDQRGFYRPLQCHTALGVCWCVDVHGVERAGTRTKGTPHCPAEKRPDVGELISDDEDSAAGSGDSEPFDF